MIETLHIENFRSFEDYTLTGLRRVNLLVGPNGCGKTTVLEAVQFAVWGGAHDVLLAAAIRRGEGTYANADSQYFDVLPFFRGHRADAGTTASVEASPTYGTVTLGVMDDANTDGASAARRTDLSTRPVMLLQSSLSGGLGDEDWTSFISPMLGSVAAVARGPFPLKATKPGNFISAVDRSPARLADEWAGALMRGRDRLVVDAIATIYEGVTGLVFVPPGSDDLARARPAVAVSVAGADERVPLGSLGHGTGWMLTLALGLAGSSGGVLLVDEIDTGLHYSFMDKLWKLVIETARKLDVQVFATTHSLDCIRGLGELLDREPELLADVSIQKIERGLSHSVESTGHSLEVVLKHGIEVRG